MNNSYVVSRACFPQVALALEAEKSDQPCVVRKLGYRVGGYDETAVRSGIKDLVKRGREMMTTDQDFFDSISGSTGDVRNVRTRLDKVREAVAETLR